MHKNHTFVCIDCETGGVDKEKNQHASKFAITEIGLVSYDLEFNPISEFRCYIKGQYVGDEYRGYDPDLRYTADALRYTGISIEKLEKEGIDHKLAVKHLIDEFKKAHAGAKYKKPIIVGHNVAYDIPFLSYLFAYCEEDLSKYLAGYFDHFDTFQPYIEDTMYMARYLDPSGKQKNNLGTVCKRFGIELHNAHTALADAKATAKLHEVFVNRLRSQSVNVGQSNETRTREHFEIQS